MMTEQAGPRQLVDDVVRVEGAGFDFSFAWDRHSPWLESQGRSPCVWAVLGAAAQATGRIPLMTCVTCPTTRCHPAAVAQKAATLELLSEDRFRLGLGLGSGVRGADHAVRQGRLHRDRAHADRRRSPKAVPRLGAREAAAGAAPSDREGVNPP